MFLSPLPAAMTILAQGAVLSVALALPAAAATMKAVYTGTMFDGSHDRTGVFGVPGTDLDGSVVTVTFLYDTTLGSLTDGGAFQLLTGGSFDGTSSPVSALVTINGVTHTNRSDERGIVASYALGVGVQTETYHSAFRFFDDVASRYSSSAVAYIGSTDGSIAVPTDLTMPFVAIFDPSNSNQYGYGSFGFQYIAKGPGGEVELDYVVGRFTPTRVVVTNVAPVPLPASGLLALAGLGALVGLRRRAGRSGLSA